VGKPPADATAGTMEIVSSIDAYVNLIAEIETIRSCR
jgi:hypothetical protein